MYAYALCLQLPFQTAGNELQLHAGAGAEAAEQEQQVQQWQLSPEQSGNLRLLQWGGISRSTAQWPSRWGALYQGTLHLLESETAADPLQTHNIWNNR